MLAKPQSGGLTMNEDLYSIIKDTDSLESFFECITSWIINSEGLNCTTAWYKKNLEPNNVNYPLKIFKPINETLNTTK